MTLLSFSEALSDAEKLKTRQGKVKPIHLLMGNGFSQACLRDLFSYEALFNEAKKFMGKELEIVFRSLQTHDFELVSRSLGFVKGVIHAYREKCPQNWECRLIERINEEKVVLKNLLIDVISNNHPPNPSIISNEKYIACRKFLSCFEKKYTVNYDLLSYWTIMHTELDDIDLKTDDGFRDSKDDEDMVTWDVSNRYSQNVFYLHGALHLFDAASEIQKFCWSKTGINLINQLKTALGSSKYPIYVSEGTSKQKMTRILHNAYLTKALSSFGSIGGSLFIFGHSLDKNDDHILGRIVHSKLKNLYASIYGDPNERNNLDIMEKAKNLSIKRTEFNKNEKPDRKSMSNELKVQFYDASSAKVWG